MSGGSGRQSVGTADGEPPHRGPLAATPGDGADRRSVADTARDHLRAVAGGLLVGLPLLWTMEVWEDGAVLAPAKLVVLLAVGFLVVVGFNALAGFRRDRTWGALLSDAIQSMGLSAVVAGVALAVLGRLDPALGMPTLVGRVAVETLPIAFGASLAATVMAAPDEEHQPGLGAETEPVGPIGRLMVAASGALYFALNIAPTDEVRMLAAEASALQLAMAVVASLAVGLGIVFHAEFRGGRRPGTRDGPLSSPLGETAAAYVLSLLVSLLLLWAFGSTDGTGFNAVMAQVVMLGIVGSFGAAAARLLVGGGQASSSEGATT